MTKNDTRRAIQAASEALQIASDAGNVPRILEIKLALVLLKDQYIEQLEQLNHVLLAS